MTIRFICIAAALALLAATGGESPAALTKDQIRRIQEAAPARARVVPKAKRRVLIWNTPASMMDRNPHKGYCVPQGQCAIETLGRKTGAFEPVVSDDIATLGPESLATFDAIVLNNSNGQWIRPTAEDMKKLGDKYGPDADAVEMLLRKTFLDWLKGGKGLVAYHHGMAANPKWAQMREVFGAGYWGHPWNEEIGVTVEEPGHPLLAAFRGKTTFRIHEEVFQFRQPWSRKNCRVLLSIDTSATNMTVPWIHRKDGDFGLAWVKSFGKGRVFYSEFGHRTENWWNPVILQFYLDGIQFACGDLAAPTEPRADKPPWPASRPPKGRKDETHMPTEAERAKIMDAVPPMAPARPTRPRKVLIWGRVWTHVPNGSAGVAMELLGKRTGAYRAVLSDDPEMMSPENLKQFDAVFLNNLHEREPFLPDDFASLPKARQDAARKRQQELRRSLLAFVAGGKGLVGVHAATAACQTWPEYGEMIGGYYGGHIMQEVVIRPEEPDHPINACFGGREFRLRDEVYIAREPYSRKKLRVLAGLDLSKMTDPAKRPDKDYAVSWVKPYGKGRVFYCTLGHQPATYWNPVFLQHVLAGIQFATGDLKAPAAPK